MNPVSITRTHVITRNNIEDNNVKIIPINTHINIKHHITHEYSQTIDYIAKFNVPNKILIKIFLLKWFVIIITDGKFSGFYLILLIYFPFT